MALWPYGLTERLIVLWSYGLMVFYGLMVLLMLSCVLMIMTTFTLFGLTTYCAAKEAAAEQLQFCEKGLHLLIVNLKVE